MFRQEYKARITFVEELPFWGFSDKASDGIHPDTKGHKRIRDAVVRTLVKGEVVGFH